MCAIVRPTGTSILFYGCGLFINLLWCTKPFVQSCSCIPIRPSLVYTSLNRQLTRFFFSSSGTIKRVEYCIYMRTKTNTHLSQHAIQTRLSKQVKHQFNLIDPTLVEVCPVGMKDKCIENRFDSILLKYAICHTCTLLCPIRFSFHIGYGLVTIVLLGR